MIWRFDAILQIGCLELFGCTMEEVRSGVCDISQWIPNFTETETLQKIRNIDGLVVKVRSPLSERCLASRRADMLVIICF